MPNPTLSSDPAFQTVQQPERQRFEGLLQRIQHIAHAQGQDNPELKVQAGRSVIYRGVPTQDPVSENIPLEVV